MKKHQAEGNMEMNSYKDKDLFKRYLKLFGNEPPFPPEHIMKTLVKMKEDGTFEEKLNLVKGKRTKIYEKIGFYSSKARGLTAIYKSL